MTKLMNVVGALVALIAACGTDPYTNENPLDGGGVVVNPEPAVDGLHYTDLKPTEATFAWTVTNGDARGFKFHCYVESDPNFKPVFDLHWNEMSWTMRGLLPGTVKYTAKVCPVNSRGEELASKCASILFDTPAKPVLDRWHWLLESNLQGHIKQVPPPGKETNPDWNYEGELTLGEDALGKLIGPFGDAGRQTFLLDTLEIKDSVTGFIAPCDSTRLTLWSAETKAMVDSFNQSHGACREGVSWRIEYVLGGELTELFER